MLQKQINVSMLVKQRKKEKKEKKTERVNFKLLIEVEMLVIQTLQGRTFI